MILGVEDKVSFVLSDHFEESWSNRTVKFSDLECEDILHIGALDQPEIMIYFALLEKARPKEDKTRKTDSTTT